MSTSLKERYILRKVLPYGVFIHGDGSETLFDREYKAIATRTPDKSCVYPTNETPRFERQAWFYDDGGTPWSSIKSKRRCQAALYYFITGQPIEALFINASRGRST